MRNNVPANRDKKYERVMLSFGYVEKIISCERNEYRKDELFDLAEELKSFIALNILSFHIIEF